MTTQPETSTSCEVCGQSAIGVCSVLLAQPCSAAYCRRCLTEGYEIWWVVVGTVASCTLGYDLPPRSWRDALAPWAIEIIDRSLTFHNKTEAELVAEVEACDD